MGRRPKAGRDEKIKQGQRRDAFFARLRGRGNGRAGGAPRVASAAEPATPTADEATSEA